MAAKNFGRVNVSVTASTGGLTAGLSRAAKQVKSFGASVASAVRGLAAPLLVLTSVGTAMAAFSSTASAIDEASKSARRLGMETATFQTLGQVAEEAGLGVGQMTNMLTFMSRNLANLQNGSKSAQTAFSRLGLTFSMLNGMSPDKQFTLIAQRIMALPTAAQRAQAAMAIFGRAGAMGLGFIEDAASGAYAEMERLRNAAGVNVTSEQAKGVEMMNDAWARTAIVVQGFITQLVAGVAPAITAMSNLFVQFFTDNTSDWTIAKMAAESFSWVLREVAAYVTFIRGGFQLFGSVVASVIGNAISAVGAMIDSLRDLLKTMAEAAAALPGFDVGLAETLNTAANMTENDYATEGAIWAQAATDLFAQGMENIENPYAGFDREVQKVQEDMAKAGRQGGNEFAAALAASSKSLKAIVVGTSEGESYTNRIRMGFDPRDAGDAAAETAENTERAADGIDQLNDNLAGINLGLATIAV